MENNLNRNKEKMVLLSLNKRNLWNVFCLKKSICAHVENRDIKIKDDNANKFVKQHRDFKIYNFTTHEAIYHPESIFTNIECATIYQIFTPSTQCRCCCVQDNHQYALSKALMCIVNIPVLLTDRLYLVATGIWFINHKRTLHLLNTYAA